MSYNRDTPPSSDWHWVTKDWGCSQDFEASTVSEITVEHVLDRIPEGKIHETLMSWFNLLSHGGQITLVVTDFESVARAYLSGALDLPFVFGRIGERSSFHSLEALVYVCRDSGLRIITARTEGYAAVVVARRP